MANERESFKNLDPSVLAFNLEFILLKAWKKMCFGTIMDVHSCLKAMKP